MHGATPDMESGCRHCYVYGTSDSLLYMAVQTAMSIWCLYVLS